MPRATEQSIHEVDFCSQVASAANVLFSQDRDAYAFAEARVEGFGSGAARKKRKDLRFFGSDGKLALCGEVKLPGTVEGRSAFDDRLYQDAATKADNAGVRYFFTWNVNEFVLWDRSLWENPPLERRVRVWKLDIPLACPEDVARPDNLEFIKTRFVPDLLRDLSDIYSGKRRDWAMQPDDIFIRSLESHLDWPVVLTTSYLIERTSRNKTFDAKVQQWLADQDWVYVRNSESEWRNALSNMAKTLAYVWANRLIFYKALRARFELPRLELKKSIKTAEQAALALDTYFERAVERSGDYKPLLFPNAKDWATGLVFEPPNAIDAWRGLLRGIESVDFKKVSSDILGRIFQKLIGPEERHRYGQHFTGDDAVDLVNAFCIRNASDKVLDPACGSGSFLVRAYYRKSYLDPKRHHLDHIFELFGCDIALYPAHLATLNLAAREISDEANYPRVVRRDFFDTDRAKPFHTVPDDAGGSKDIYLPELDAVVGNPPYVRQEKIGKTNKPRYASLVTRAWPDMKLTGRADLHCYFWPVATKLLKNDGFFGFLTSSSWMDVEYGFALQGWILRHFKLLAVMESAAEPWFTDARVKTVATILQRCDNESERMANLVHFVRFEKPLKDIIGVSPEDEKARQRAVEKLRDRILSAKADTEDDMLRMIVIEQQDLWNEGVRAGSILGKAERVASPSDDEDDDDEDDAEESKEHFEFLGGEYVAGKWGRYVRAPDFYFEVMRQFRKRFVALGEIALVRRGITSGCDAFFMPRDVTQDLLNEIELDTGFPRRAGGASRKDVESGKLRIIEAGDGSIHAIESEFLAPEVHSMMKVERPVVRARDLDRVVLMVGRSMKELRGTWVHKYLKYGEQATFASKKSKAVPVPERSTCAARDPWYDLTMLVKPGFAFWPKAQQYRHIIPANPERAICNCNLYDVASDALSSREQTSLVAILNSTLIGLFKTFYGRFAGTEGNLKTEVVDVKLLEVPDPRGITTELSMKLSNAVKSMSKRTVGRLIEEQLMDCHSPERARRIANGPLVLSDELRQEDRLALDDAVFELLGVVNSAERARLVRRLHEDTAWHFRAIRVVEIEKMEQRAGAANSRFSPQELAADAWDAIELPDVTPLAEWIKKHPDCTSPVNIPEERPAQLTTSPMFDPNAVYFGKNRSSHMDCQSNEEAQLIVRLANLGVTGWIKLPATKAKCQKLLNEVNDRMRTAVVRFEELATSRTSNPALQTEIVDQLTRWFACGRNVERPAASALD